MVMTVNRHELRDMQRMVEEELGLEFRYDAMINPGSTARDRPERAAEPEEIVALDLQDRRRASEWGGFAGTFPESPAAAAPGASSLIAGAGCILCHRPAGRLSNCSSGTAGLQPTGGTFKEGWESYLASIREEKAARRTQCTACGIRDMCGMCPANGVLECLDAEEPVDFSAGWPI
jgi:radical SAM protein with 4Fe4S-binding SPASM domain